MSRLGVSSSSVICTSPPLSQPHLSQAPTSLVLEKSLDQLSGMFSTFEAPRTTPTASTIASHVDMTTDTSPEAHSTSLVSSHPITCVTDVMILIESTPSMISHQPCSSVNPALTSRSPATSSIATPSTWGTTYINDITTLIVSTFYGNVISYFGEEHRLCTPSGLCISPCAKDSSATDSSTTEQPESMLTTCSTTYPASTDNATIHVTSTMCPYNLASTMTLNATSTLVSTTTLTIGETSSSSEEDSPPEASSTTGETRSTTATSVIPTSEAISTKLLRSTSKCSSKRCNTHYTNSSTTTSTVDSFSTASFFNATRTVTITRDAPSQTCCNNPISVVCTTSTADSPLTGAGYHDSEAYTQLVTITSQGRYGLPILLLLILLILLNVAILLGLVWLIAQQSKAKSEGGPGIKSVTSAVGGLDDLPSSHGALPASTRRNTRDSGYFSLEDGKRENLRPTENEHTSSRRSPNNIQPTSQGFHTYTITGFR